MKVFSIVSLFFVATTSLIPAAVQASSKNSKDAASAESSGSAMRNKRSSGGGDHEDDDKDGDSYYLSAIVTLDPVILPKSGTWNRDVVTDALIKADAMINTNSKFHAQSGFIAKYVDIPEDGDSCDDDDDDDKKEDGPDGDLTQTRRYYGTLYWHNINYGCGMGCSWDDDSFLTENKKMITPLDLFVEVSNGRTPKHHRALEMEFCVLLRESGEPALAGVETCTIDYVFNGDDDFMRRGPAALTKKESRVFGASFVTTPMNNEEVDASSSSSLAVEK
ncbi:hypothetical protein ACA910_006591 [Epithemia clementina (nom. ined.)]